MKISRFVVNPIEENTYILWDEEKREAAIVDPGMMRANERNVVDEFVSKNNLSVKMVLMTHLHFDHAASARYIADKYGVKVYGSLDDAHLGEALPTQSRMFGMEIDIKPLFIDEALHDNDVLMLADEEIKVLAVPGHSAGSVAFYLPASGVVFVGDTLFNQGIGRTDLPGGNYRKIVQSIKEKLYTLPGETVVLPGHGGSTTIDDEKNYNPYITV